MLAKSLSPKKRPFIFLGLFINICLENLLKAYLENIPVIRCWLSLYFVVGFSPSAINGRIRCGDLSFSHDFKASLFNPVRSAYWKVYFFVMSKTTLLNLIRAILIFSLAKAYLFGVVG